MCTWMIAMLKTKTVKETRGKKQEKNEKCFKGFTSKDDCG